MSSINLITLDPRVSANNTTTPASAGAAEALKALKPIYAPAPTKEAGETAPNTTQDLELAAKDWSEVGPAPAGDVAASKETDLGDLQTRSQIAGVNDRLTSL